MENLIMQDLNRKTMEHIKKHLRVGMNLLEVRDICERYMLTNGASSFWYWDIGAFVFLGDETSISISGTQYETSNKIIQENDILTIDLSPQYNNIWGDYARTIIIEDGKIIDNIDDVKNSEWKMGLQMEEYLHNLLIEFVNIETTFEELYYYINEAISQKGFINLDFMGNLGHSIVKNKNDRIYIEKGNKAKLSQVGIFTFEPHISIPNSKYGYKREDIYYFDNRKLKKL